jgi:hypothetical protein
MNRSAFLSLAVLMTLFVACTKENEVAQEVGLVPDSCGSAGARIQASVDGGSYCANAQIMAVAGAGSAMVTGVDLLGNTLVIQFDTLAVGQHTITEAQNGVLYMQTGQTFTVAPGITGTLHITTYDSVQQVLSAHFSVQLYNEMSGATRVVDGEVDVVYTIEE